MLNIISDFQSILSKLFSVIANFYSGIPEAKEGLVLLYRIRI